MVDAPPGTPDEADARTEALERQLAEARAESERLDRELNVSQMQEAIGIERFQAAEAFRDRLAADNARLRDMAFRAADQCDLWIKQTYSGGWSAHQVESQRELAKSLRLSAGKE